ncbi:MAG: hypothetical protein HKN67_00185 [Saprospiraceae bacterium]|nr:hypothetical protein [Saprospiraceae bacterium]
MISRFLFLLLVGGLILCSCHSEKNYLPKPRVYPRIDFPEKGYTLFDNEDCPFRMNIPSYFEFKKDSLSLEEGLNTDCWFDLNCIPLNASLHMSYLPVNSRKEFDDFVEDAFELVDKHNVKANYRDEYTVNMPGKNLYGVTFELDGPVAAPLQFYLTDSTSHFLRGSLYFRSRVNRDSLAPVYNFIKEDFDLMIESFLWHP